MLRFSKSFRRRRLVVLRATSLNCIHHTGRSILFECLQMVILSRSDDGLLGIDGADVVVLLGLDAPADGKVVKVHNFSNLAPGVHGLRVPSENGGVESRHERVPPE